MVIPMEPPSPQVPSGPMKRARARVLETEVTSLVIDIPYDPRETWLIPQSGLLCVLRYQESNQVEVAMQDKHQEHVDDLPSPEGPEQPPNHRPGGTTGQLPPNNRPTFCDRPEQGRCCTGFTGFCPKTGTIAPTSGTTAGSFDAHLQEPVPDLPAVVPPSSTGTTAPHELSAVLPAP